MMKAKIQKRLKGKPKFAVVVDGETEFWYLKMLQRNEKLLKVDVKPEIPQKKKLIEQYLKVIELSKSYDKVYWIVDLDVILNESVNVKQGQQKTFDKFINYKRIIASKHKKVKVLINQPCFEFWFLLHFQLNSGHFSNCNEATNLLRKFIPDYEKTEKYFVKKDIYSRLKPKLKDAISNSKKLLPFNIENIQKGVSEMHQFFEDIDVNK